MSEFVLLTDSSADLSQEMVEELGVTVLPLSFTIQGRTYHDYPDGREMNLPLFYDMLRAGELATTAAVNKSEFTQALERVFLGAVRHLPGFCFGGGGSAGEVSRAEDLYCGYPVCLLGTGAAGVAGGPGAEKGKKH